MDTESPIRVLHILGSVQRGGTESVVFNNYRHIDRNKVQFDIAIDDNSPYDIPKDIKDMGCRVYTIPPYTKQPAYIIAIAGLCRKNKYTIVHSHMNAMNVFPLFAAWLAKVPVRIAHSHSAAAKGKGECKRNILKYVLRPLAKVFATQYFACSNHAARWLFGNSLVDKGRVVILNNAILPEHFRFDRDKRREMRKKLGLENQFIIANVGRFSPQKNHFFLIEIFYALVKIRSDAHLLLIGGIGSAGNGIEEGLKEKISQYGISSHVRFLGAMEDISDYYQAMDVLVLPSLYEGLGIACVEAQCSGLPCIVSDRVPREVKINENVVFLSLNDPPEKWAETIIETTGERGDYSTEIDAAGYRIEKAAKKLESLYIAYEAECGRKACCE